MRKTGESEALRCSFCGKEQAEVGKLIAGPNVFICDECVDCCNAIIASTAQPAATETDGSPLVATADSAAPGTGCVLCGMPIVATDGLWIRERGLVCFGCLGEVEAAIAEHRAGDEPRLA